MQQQAFDYSELLAEEFNIQGVQVGEIVQVDNDGQIWVDFPENPSTPATARSIVLMDIKEWRQAMDSKRSTLIVFQGGDPCKPIILGFVQTTIIDTFMDTLMTSVEKPQQIIVDGEKVVVEAKEEIVLRCGKGSIGLYKNGRVVIKGTNLINRSMGVNKIKGAAVRIN